jgi:hypothetical protein
MKATHLLDGDHLGPILRLDGARVGTVLLQGKMGPRPTVVVSIRGQYASQVTFVENDDVVGAIASDRSNDTLDVRVLPGRSWRRHDLFYAHRFDPTTEVRAIRCVTVAQQMPGRGVPRKRLSDLAGEPACSRMLRYIQMH